MKLLFITQKMDKNDDLLGVYHEWVKKIAAKCESVKVVCLFKGENNLPANVEVFSLGKEKKESNIRYLVNFYKYIWRLRKQYDTVFVHMNPEYAILGGPFWKIWSKKIFFWYNHKKGGWKTKIAFFWPKKIFYTSKQSFSSSYSRAEVMPAGISLDRFKSQEGIKKIKNSILSLGRISPVKKLEILVNALEVLDKKSDNFYCGLYGDAPEKDEKYYLKLKKSAEDLERRGKIVFHKGVPNHKAPEVFNQYEIFVNLTPSGSFDKTIVEAAACGCLPIVCNKSFTGIFEDIFLFEENNVDNLAEKIKSVINLPDKEKEKYREKMIEFSQTHSLDRLVEKLVYAFKE